MSKDQPSKTAVPANNCDDNVLLAETKTDFHDNEISERELLIFRAQLCEQAGRFEDMVNAMNELCQKYDDLAHDEKNLLSCAYKNVIGSRRTSWRILSEYLPNNPTQCNNIINNNNNNNNNINSEQQQQQKHNKNIGNNNNDNNSIAISPLVGKEPKFDHAIVHSISKTIELELRKHCNNIIDILTTRLIPSSSATGESRVFYQKMKGDYLRYLCEISLPEERKEKSNESLLAYKTACDKAMIELPPTHPVRLGLMLNFSVFYYDIMKSPERSCRLAKQAFDDAIAELDTLSEESYRDSTIIMQLLRDNLNLWESEKSLQQQQQQQQATTAAVAAAAAAEQQQQQQQQQLIQ